MTKRTSVSVPQEEIARQLGYIHQIRELHGGTLKKYTLTTFGCQMNENDSERLAGMLAEMGYCESSEAFESDLIIYNTCCVRENAELKVYGHLGALKKLKETRPDLIIAVCGCMMQQKDVVEAILKKYRHVDLVFGTHNLYKFPEMLSSVIGNRDRVIEVWESGGTIAEDMPIERKEGVKAWVTVMYGCDNFCSYCIVPYVRGRERSRGPEEILKEVRRLAEDGFKEITLLGQNVNSYGKDLEVPVTFGRLLLQLQEVEGIERIRFMTSHPKDLSQELIQAIKSCSKVCNHIHLPVQAGSSRILNAMNRKYTKEEYLSLVGRIREEIPGLSLTTDIIVGFPGETEEDFLETLEVLEKIRCDMAYTFLYSKRTGTPAAKYRDQVSEDVMKDRFDRLQVVQNRISREINDSLLGQTLEVLVEGYSRNNNGSYTGRTQTNKIVHFKGEDNLVGRLVKIKIEKVQTWSLEGVLAK